MHDALPIYTRIHMQTIILGGGEGELCSVLRGGKCTPCPLSSYTTAKGLPNPVGKETNTSGNEKEMMVFICSFRT